MAIEQGKGNKHRLQINTDQDQNQLTFCTSKCSQFASRFKQDKMQQRGKIEQGLFLQPDTRQHCHSCQGFCLSQKSSSRTRPTAEYPTHRQLCQNQSLSLNHSRTLLFTSFSSVSQDTKVTKGFSPKCKTQALGLNEKKYKFLGKTEVSRQLIEAASPHHAKWDWSTEESWSPFELCKDLEA